MTPISKIIIVSFIILIITVLIQPYIGRVYIGVIEESFEDDAASMQRELTILKNENNALTRDLNASRNEKIQKEIELSEKFNNCLNDKILIQQRIDGKNMEVNNMREDIIAEKQKYVELQQKLEDLIREKAVLQEEMSKVNDNSSRFSSQVSDMQSQLEKCNSYMSKAYEDNNSLQRANTELIQSNQTLIKDYDKCSKEYNKYCYEYHISQKKKGLPEASNSDSSLEGSKV